MSAVLALPIAVESRGMTGSCGTCGVRRTSVCDAIPEADLAHLARAAMSGVARPGASFIREGDPAAAFFNITSGAARLFKLLPDGRRQITGFASPGQFLGLAMSDSFAFNAEAMATVHYCRFPRARLRALIDDFPAMEQRLLRVASAELVAAQEQMLLLGRKSAREKMASFLMAQSHLGAICQIPPVRFTLPMARGDIADYLGLTIETISRTLTKFRIEGLIEIVNTVNVVIRDGPALRHLADATA